MKSQTYHYTCMGGRNNNQDSLWYSEKDGYGLWVVADGLGGHRHSERASALAVKTIETACEKDPETELAGLLTDCHEKILKMQEEQPDAENAASTAVVARWSGNGFECAHVGDSRLYYFRDDKLLFRTKDHSVAQLNVSLGEITEKEQRSSPDRNKLYNVLGGKEFTKAEVRVPFAPKPQDACVLCSDGFWEFIDETEMILDLIKSSSAKTWADNMLVRIHNRLPDATDNYSLLCVIFTE